MAKHGIIALLAYTAFLGSAAAQTPVSFPPTVTYIQANSGMKFPPSVGSFRREEVTRYRPDGSDESVGYNRLTPGTEIGATVYVFPPPVPIGPGAPQNTTEEGRRGICQALFQGVEQTILSQNLGAVLVGNGDTVLVQGTNSYKGYKASFTLTNEGFFGRRNVPSRSELYVFCVAGGKWAVEYRIDYPAPHDATQAIANFMRNLVLTIRPEK